MGLRAKLVSGASVEMRSQAERVHHEMLVLKTIVVGAAGNRPVVTPGVSATPANRVPPAPVSGPGKLETVRG